MVVMRNIIIWLLVIAVGCLTGFAQSNSVAKDSINNLILPKGYKTSIIGEVPRYQKVGKGRQALILIPGIGFNETVFNDFVTAFKNNYVLYSITVAGFGKTSAPPTPAPETSFGDQTWNKSAIHGIKNLIEKEQIVKPIIVGHFTLGTQLALRFVLDYPDLVSGLIILGGPAKLIATQNGQPMDYPLNGLINYTDRVTAPKFFKGMNEQAFNSGNYLPEVYSLTSGIGSRLWNEVAANPLPVMVRYLCEFHASDLRLETDRIKCPVLILRPGFTNELLSHPENPNTNYIKLQFIDGWQPVVKSNPEIEIIDIQNSGAFLWKDQPEKTYKEINHFIETKIRTIK